MSTRKELSEQNIPYVKTMLRAIRDCGGKEIRISFDGSGDSGSIEDTYIYVGDTRLAVEFNVDYMTSTSQYNAEAQGWITTIEKKTMPVKDALEQYCYDKLEDTGIDWYNNDGGYGELVITLDPVEINLEVNTRYTETSTDSFDLTEELWEEE